MKDLQERRQTSRVDCCYQVECRLGSEEFGASVIEMGLGGMRLLCGHQFDSESCLTVRQPDRHSSPISVRVVWTRPQTGTKLFETGVVYVGAAQQLETSWVKAALQGLGFEGNALHERRRHLRTRTNVGGSIHLVEASFACKILDLGLGGALIQTPTPIPQACEGTEVHIEIDNHSYQRLAGRIVYLRNPQEEKPQESARRYGICFAKDEFTRTQARLIEGYVQAMR